MASNQSNEKDGSQPSMAHGHMAYVAGAAKETIAPYTSDPPSWKDSASAQKSSAVEEMRAAKAASDSSPAKNETVGKMEEKLGAVTGCEGMVGEGKDRSA